MGSAPPDDLRRPAWLEFIRRHIFVLAFLAGALTLTCLRLSGRMRHVPDPPPVQFRLPSDYALVDQCEAPFTPETLRGKVWVAGFVFTTCPSSCPAVTRAMQELHDRFQRYSVDVEMVTFTVDPAHDTPGVLRAYAEPLGVSCGGDWRFVTGDPAAVISLVSDGFKLGVGDRQADATGAAYDIAHSTRLALVDASGGVRGTYEIDPEHGTDEIFERAQHVLVEMEKESRR